MNSPRPHPCPAAPAGHDQGTRLTGGEGATAEAGVEEADGDDGEEVAGGGGGRDRRGAERAVGHHEQRHQQSRRATVHRT